MNEVTDEAVRGLLALSRWYVDAVSRHSAELRGLTTGLLTGQKVGLSYAEMRRCERLDHAVFILACEAEQLLCELRDGFALAPTQAEVLGRLRAEHDQLLDEHRLQMEGVQRVWADGEPPQ